MVNRKRNIKSKASKKIPDISVIIRNINDHRETLPYMSKKKKSTKRFITVLFVIEKSKIETIQIYYP